MNYKAYFLSSMIIATTIMVTPIMIAMDSSIVNDAMRRLHDIRKNREEQSAEDKKYTQECNEAIRRQQKMALCRGGFVILAVGCWCLCMMDKIKKEQVKK